MVRRFDDCSVLLTVSCAKSLPKSLPPNLQKCLSSSYKTWFAVLVEAMSWPEETMIFSFSGKDGDIMTPQSIILRCAEGHLLFLRSALAAEVAYSNIQLKAEHRTIWLGILHDTSPFFQERGTHGKIPRHWKDRSQMKKSASAIDPV